jgi:Rrf2 family transcriptional regulator, iron-sulfur cluster assembly transcription factor
MIVSQKNRGYLEPKRPVIYYRPKFHSVSRMSLLSRKGLLAITAVVDIAVHAAGQPVSAKALAARNILPPRHLEPVLQALVRAGILRGIRGPRGGYQLGRERRRITAEDILRAAQSLEEDTGPAVPNVPLLSQVVLPAVAQADRAFSAALARINVEELALRAQAVRR